MALEAWRQGSTGSVIFRANLTIVRKVSNLGILSCQASPLRGGETEGQGLGQMPTGCQTPTPGLPLLTRPDLCVKPKGKRSLWETHQQTTGQAKCFLTSQSQPWFQRLRGFHQGPQKRVSARAWRHCCGAMPATRGCGPLGLRLLFSCSLKSPVPTVPDTGVQQKVSYYSMLWYSVHAGEGQGTGSPCHNP